MSSQETTNTPPLPDHIPSPAAAAAVGLVGLLFLVSAWAKLDAPGVFEITLVKQEIFSSRDAAAWPSRLLIAFELALGLGLLQPWRRRTVFAPTAAATLLGFSVWLAYLIVAGKEVEDCGCFGELMKITPGVALVRNLVFLGVIAAAWRRLGERRPWLIPAAIGVVALIATFTIAPVKTAAPPPPDKADGTPLPQSEVTTFTEFSDGTVDLQRGTHLIAFLSLECEHCMEVAGQLAAHADQLPAVRIVYFGQEAQIPEFEGMSGSGFPWHLTDPGRFFDFIGDAPPRVYLLHDGSEVARWDEADFSVRHIIDAAPK